MRDQKGEHPFGDAGQLILFIIFLLVWIADSFFLHISTGWLQPVPLIFRLMAGCVILVLSVYLFKSGHQAVRDEERPVRVLSKGAFHYIRHPLYLSGLLVYLAMAVFTGSLLSLMLLLLIGFFYNIIASFEETVMENKFGEEYAVYKKRTGRWIPRLSHKIVRTSD